MRTEPRCVPTVRRVVSTLFASFALASAVSAQQSDGPSLFLVDTETRVSALRFAFPSGNALDESRLKDQIATRGPGRFVWLRRTFDFMPGISGPTYAAFSPVVLQRDVARLRQRYRTAGFPSVRVDYDVALDTTDNRVRVTMVVDQGEPLTIDTLAVRVAERTEQGDGGLGVAPTASLPEDIAGAWSDFVEDLASARRARFSQQERTRLINETTDWFLQRGYPWASTSVTRSDTLESGVHLELTAVPGRRATVREIRLEGQERLSRDVILREIPIRIGDWYSSRRVSEGQSELFELDLVRQALGDIVDGSPGDSTVALRFRISESRPRLIWGRAGWRSESGMAVEAHWQHRDFLGGARTLTLSTNVESGWLRAFENTEGRSVGVSALVRQPYFLQRTMAASFGPFARFRDDVRDRSLLFGVETAVLYRKRALESVTVQHELSRRRVDATYQLTPLSEVVAQGDRAFGPFFVKSVFKITGAYGTLDDRINPTRGYLLEPSVEVTGPTGVTEVEYLRVGFRGMAAVPMGRRAIWFFRGSAGRLFPFGESDPERAASPTRAIVGLRDVMFTAGGTTDVRGWGSGLLGSKIPDVSLAEDGTVVADRFVPAGGLARLTGTAELGLPFPFLPDPHRSFFFLDAGRVWSPGDAFDPVDPELRREGWAYGVGGGLDFSTLVGPIRIAVGYKLNPVPADMLSPGAVARAIVDGVPLATLDQKSYRRWHLHLSIGRAF